MPTKKKARSKAAQTAALPDLRPQVKPTAAAFGAAVGDVRKIVDGLEAPAEPSHGDLVYALLHASFRDGLPCGTVQEILRRLENSYVDRNELRVTEAFEIAEALDGLEVPDLFDRCMAVRDSIAQIYNDQNSVSLDFLREATVTERNQFFARVPAIQTGVSRFLVQLVALEECIFSPRSTQRVLVRLGFDPKASAVHDAFGELRLMLAPFGYLPLHVGADAKNGKPIAEPVLCPACRLMQLVASKR